MDDDDALYARYCNPNLSVKEQDEEDEMHEESKEVVPDPIAKLKDEKFKQNVMRNVKALIPPPLPLLPKSYAMSLDEPAKSGCAYWFIQLSKFRGWDQTCKIEESNDPVEKHEYNPSQTLMEVFDINRNDKNIVYLWTN